MRVLVVTKIFPNAREPSSAPFNRQQLAALARRCEVEVLATIPWLPGARLLPGTSRAVQLVDVPARDTIDGLPVEHPRYAYVPKVGDAVASALYAASVLPALRRRRGRFDVLLASWAYPDGAATVDLGRLFDVPVVVKAHGSDLNVLAERPVVRAHLRRTLPRAAAFVAPSRALIDRALALGVAPDRATHVPNGVDASRFHPLDRAQARAALGLRAGPLVVCVGRLEEGKGSLDLLAALDLLLPARGVRAAFVGDGSARAEIERRAASGRVIVAGQRPHDEIPRWLAAADVVVLPSWNEGTPNAVLEALACGRRVVATRVGGVPDVIDDEALGLLVPPRDPAALARAIDRALAEPVGAGAITERARIGSWDDSAAILHRVLARALEEHPR
ncbi:MAG: glycosyltransferase family 4 protein [Deltaproteobacteria bacterium]|nr:glycosyltransferase family 4 protein [Deltaproteobacteria bacterium]